MYRANPGTIKLPGRYGCLSLCKQNTSKMAKPWLLSLSAYVEGHLGVPSSPFLGSMSGHRGLEIHCLVALLNQKGKPASLKGRQINWFTDLLLVIHVQLLILTLKRPDDSSNHLPSNAVTYFSHSS